MPWVFLRYKITSWYLFQHCVVIRRFLDLSENIGRTPLLVQLYKYTGSLCITFTSVLMKKGVTCKHTFFYISMPLFVGSSHKVIRHSKITHQLDRWAFMMSVRQTHGARVLRAKGGWIWRRCTGGGGAGDRRGCWWLTLAFTCKPSAAGHTQEAAKAEGCLGSCCTEHLPVQWWAKPGALLEILLSSPIAPSSPNGKWQALVMLHGRCLSPKPLKAARVGWFSGWFRYAGASGVPSHSLGTLAAGRVRQYEGICRISEDEGQWLQARCWNRHFLPVCGAFHSVLAHPTRVVVLWLKYLPFKEDVKLQFPSSWGGLGCTNRNHLRLQDFWARLSPSLPPVEAVQAPWDEQKQHCLGSALCALHQGFEEMVGWWNWDCGELICSGGVKGLFLKVVTHGLSRSN